MIDHEKFQPLIRQRYRTTADLKLMFPGRHFTPDGHMVGSIGECLVADAYGLELLTASNKGQDAVTAHGKKVEIKATQAQSVAFRREAGHTIIIKIMPDGTFQEFYSGPGYLVWEQFEGNNLPSNGPYQISLRKLGVLNETVEDSQRIPKVT